MPARRGQSAAGGARTNQPANNNSSSPTKNNSPQHALLRQYAGIKQLIHKGHFESALEQGWSFLQQVKSAQAAERDSRCLQELFLAASLNVVLCSAELHAACNGKALGKLNATASELLLALRRGPSSATATPHGEMLTKCLLKVVTRVAQQATPSPQPADAGAVQGLLALLLAAAEMCGQSGLPQQVVMRAFQQLPASLHHCLLLMLAHAAGLWHADVVTAAQAAAPVAAHTALVCLRQLASSVEFDASCISACLSSLCVGGPCKAHLHDSMCLLMAAICHKCGELAADPPAALLSALQHLATQPHIRHQQRQQQPMGGGSSSSASAVRNKSVELPPAPDDRGDGSLQPAMVQLQVWCIQELQQAGTALLGSCCPLIVSTAAATARSWCCSDADAPGDADLALQQAAEAVAGAAACLASCWQLSRQHKEGSSAAAAAAAAEALADASACRDLAGEYSGSCPHAAARSEHWDHLQWLSAAVEQLTSWGRLVQQPGSAHAAARPPVACAEQLASVCTWLAGRLQAAALAACRCPSASPAAAAGASQPVILSDNMAAGLWLLAVKCSLAAAALTASGCSTASASHCCAAVAAMTRALQAMGPWFAWLRRSTDTAAASPAAAATGIRGRRAAHRASAGRPAAGAQTQAGAAATAQPQCSMCAGSLLLPAQHLLQVAVHLMLQLSAKTQQQLEQQWQSTLRHYSRLRCSLYAAGLCGCEVARQSHACPAGSQASSSSWVQVSGAVHTETSRCQGPCQQAGQHTPHVLSSVLQLAATAGAASQAAGGQHPVWLDRLCWLEGVALRQVHSSTAAKGSSAAATAALCLLKEQAGADSLIVLAAGGEVLQQARVAMVRAMILLLLLPAGMNIREASRQEVAAGLQQACALFEEVLQAAHPAAHDGGSGGGKQCRQQLAPCSKVRGKAAAAGNEVSAAQDTLLCAGLCHCLLGLLLAQPAMSINTPHPAGGLPGSPELHPGAAPGAAGTTAVRPSIAYCRHTSPLPRRQDLAEDGDALWTQVSNSFAHSSRLLEAAAACACPNSTPCCDGLWCAGEAAAAVAQAWHVAALQDWDCQHTFAGVLAHMCSTTAAQHDHQGVAGLLPLLPASSWATAGSSWLSLLVQQQVLGGSDLGHRSGTLPRNAAAQCTTATAAPARCLCQLQRLSHALNAAAGVDGPAELPPPVTGWQLLQQVQVQLAAAEAAACLGDTSTAAALAEVAGQRCRSGTGAQQGPQASGSLPANGGSRNGGESSSSSTTTTTSRCSSSTAHMLDGCHPTSVLQACLFPLHAFGLYMSSVWQLSQAADAAGNPHDAVRLLKELHRLSCNCNCAGMAALAQASLSCVYSRMAQPAKAAAAAAAAKEQQQQQLAGSRCQPSIFCVALTAAVAAAEAAVAAHGQPSAEVEACVGVGLTAFQQARERLRPEQLGWRWVGLHSQLHLLLAYSDAQEQREGAARAHVERAATLLEHTGCSRCCSGPWPTTWACVQLQLLSLNQPHWLATPLAAGSRLRVAGFHSSSHSNDLTAAFAQAAEAGAGSLQARGSTRASSRRRQPAAAQTAPAGIKAGGRQPAGRGRHVRAAQQPVGGGGTADDARVAAAADTGRSTPVPPNAAEPAQWMCRMLQVASLLAQQPLPLKQACCLLCEALTEAGAQHAAVMFQHIASGTSVTQQQLMLASNKQLQHSKQQGRPGQEPQPAPAPATAAPAHQVWGDMCTHLEYAAVLKQAAEAGCDAVLGAHDPAAQLQCAAQAVDEVAARWLTTTLQQLPSGAALCCISRRHDAQQQWLLAPARLAGQQAPANPQAVALAGSTATGGLLLSRVALASERTKLSAALLVQLPAPLDAASSSLLPQPGGVAHLLCELQTVLSDSAASMSGSNTASTDSSPASKSRWWRQRLELDKRMAHLLQRLDQQHLGAWRCLLLQPQHPAVQQAAAAASHALVDEHFDSVLDDKPRQLLAHLLALLLVSFPALATAELLQALQDLCVLAQQRMDGLHLQQLQAALVAAYSSVSQAATLSGSQQRSPPAGEALTPTSSSSSNNSNANGRVGTSHDTNAVGPLHLVKAHNRQPATDTSRSAASSLPHTASKVGRPAACHTHHSVDTAGSSSSSVPAQVPASVARHASRRSRLNTLSSNSSRRPPQQQTRCNATLQGAAGVVTSAHPNSSNMCAAGTNQVCCTRRGLSSSSSAVAVVDDALMAGEPEPASECWQPSVLLVLDDSTHQLPWESCPGLQGQAMYRCPSLACAAALAVRQGAVHSQSALQLSRSLYLLNPDGDLRATQETFEATLQQLCHQGVAGSRPPASDLLSALQCHDLFLYFGHGAAEQCIPLAALRRLERCAASLLMGCSSGRLRPAGVYEPQGPVWAYVMAGCRVTIGALWDVTDADIDRLAGGVLQCWCSGTQEDVSTTLTVGRRACRLSSMIGAAPVCYGLPACVRLYQTAVCGQYV